MNKENYKIELTPMELAMLKRDIAGDFFPPQQTDEENKALLSVINKADEAMEALDAYDELENSLMEWFLAKYQAQESSEVENTPIGNP